MKIFYALMCVFGVILPFSQFLPWLYENGLSVSTLFQQATENQISTFAWLDVVVSAVVLIGFILAEGNRLSLKNLWIPIVGTLTVGVSLGLPLFLLQRESYFETKARGQKRV